MQDKIFYKYETHCHTSPVSACGQASAEETLNAYKLLGYDGVFITNHFIDSNIGIDKNRTYKEKIEFYFSEEDQIKKLSKEIGIKAFIGIEFGRYDHILVYGLNKEWLLDHPEIENMDTYAQIMLYKQSGALVIQAHPFRIPEYLKGITLYAKEAVGAEYINACNSAAANEMAQKYIEHFDLVKFAGSDNHKAGKQKNFAGVEFPYPINTVQDFIDGIQNRKHRIFQFTAED